jgi:hypothetical protein
MRLSFNSDRVNNPVINSLTNTIDTLSDAIRQASSLDIPGGFSGASTLANLDNFLEAEKDKLVYAKEWAETSIRDYTNLEDEILRNTKTVTPSPAKIRESNIK